jgi:hypothetical protein
MIDIVGSVVFMAIFVDFVVEIAMRDIKKFKSKNEMAALMQFSE